MAKQVTASNGALTRRFPAHAVSVPLHAFHNALFQRELADKICRLDIEQVEEMIPKHQNVGQSRIRIRDTTNPSLITEMLMAILASLGTPVNVQQIQKRTRDDALLENTTLLPWRRSPLWLALRVTLQSSLAGLLPGTEATVAYKNFMIFLLAELASEASATALPGEICHVIVAKIARRVFKLGPDTQNFVRDRALKVCHAIDQNQRSQWEMICLEDGKRPTTIDIAGFERDTALSLDTSQHYIDDILGNDQDMLQPHSLFEPKCHPWLGFTRGLPTFDVVPSVHEEIVYVLAEFEAWISASLPGWTQQRLMKPVQRDCTALAELAATYRDMALPVYKEAPEQMSSMLLVIAEMWHSLDLLAVALLPLLHNFSPSIAPDLFHPLLLPKKAQMERLWNVELHIHARETQANDDNPSLFSDPEEKSFAVQYFASSKRHKDLKKVIVEQASTLRELKEAEWRKLSDEYYQWRENAKLMSCEMTLNELGQESHCTDCPKCALNRDADALTIDVHEWPLPEHAAFCKSAVFELDCPVPFAARLQLGATSLGCSFKISVDKLQWEVSTQRLGCSHTMVFKTTQKTRGLA